MYDTILIPTDGSEHAVRAGAHGLALGAILDATVHVINVIDLRTEAGPFSAGGVKEDFLEERRAEGREVIDAIVGDTDQAVETAVVEGDPENAIVDYATDQGVDLVTMGTHGRTGLGRYIAGSVCEQVIRHAPMPVMTARATELTQPAGEYDDVLVPTDGSEASTAAIAHAVAIAQATGARLHGVNVIDLGDVAASAEYSIPTNLINSLETRGEQATEVVAERAREAGLEAVTDVISGYPARDLLDYTEENGIDLITMGTAGRTGLSRFLMGSTTERIVRHSDVPVLTVNTREESPN